MNRNIGNFDRIVRVVAAAILVLLAYTGVLVGALGITGVIVAIVLFITALVGFCPAYRLIGLSTCGERR